MDAVELNYPVDVAAPKLMGSDGFGRDRVTLMEEEAAACESSRELCNSLLSKKEWTSSVNFLESTPLDKVPGSELCQHASHLPSFPSESVSKQRHCSGANGPSRVVPTPEKAHVQRKSGQMSRSGSGCHKRPQIALLEDTKGPVVVDVMKDPSDKLGSHLTKIDSQEKAHLSRQKNNFSSKRGDRRNSKVSTRAKYDSFSVKASLASFSSAAAGNNFFGLYGLKTDVHDITKLVDDLSLNDLLQGAYECPSLGKDRGKKATNTTERILHSVRKACSILQLPRSAQIQNFADIDSCSNEKMPMCQSSSISTVGNGDNGDSSTTDISLSNKDSSSKSETPANLLNFSFDQPKDTLERLTLPPPKDLESLLLDAAKPAVSSRNASEPRPGKQISRWPSLPQFPWSHTFSGHCRTNSDAVKLLTSRSTCQGRWVKMGYAFSSLGSTSNYFTNLESFAYDETLVPASGTKLSILDNNFASSTFVPRCEWGSSIASASVTSHTPLGDTCMKESGGLKNRGKVGHCPKVLAAAQTLCEIAACNSRLNRDGMIMKWPKKPTQKVMKARKSKSNEKHEEMFASSTSTRNGDQILASKRPKLSTSENKEDLVHINGVRKGPINWSTPKSSRSSAKLSVRDSTAYIVKQSCMMPPPAKVLNRTCNGQQKVRKLMRMDWSWECDRQD
ncbi:hypothetical protein P3X46_016776 [Hevea brasiliensis]|uniref:Uncharacterized protein n=1 Tax=Hevea brasiliensis TaxID=3981 RepID=A0ABQ9M457_HEVBR|nr:uncharacterized protein LOC110639713 isoform X2 [Hevea brasiliensis]KAJ9173663.1 hypothetical protein P3X46_016776 [Hevea brasiliensis]